MADSYSTQALIAGDPVFAERLRACAAQQGADDPADWVWRSRYAIASAPGWAEKVDYWLAANPDAGGEGWQNDPAVISDGDILAVIQPMLNPPPPPEPEQP